MKRCPKCEFLYEDEQRLCDMDGASLVFDSIKLPKPKKAKPKKPAAKSRPRLVSDKRRAVRSIGK